MDDVISRRDAIDALMDEFKRVPTTAIRAKNRIERLPSAEDESFEWCIDCKEYDQEEHCCHRWTKVIRNTVEELKVVRCKDCKYAEYIDDVQTLWCTECGQGRTVAPYDFCSYGEKREETT